MVKFNSLTNLIYRDTGYLISISIQYVDIFQTNTGKLTFHVPFAAEDTWWNLPAKIVKSHLIGL